jgi:hypothetical protein
LFIPNPNPNPRNLRKENPNPNPRKPKEGIKIILKPQEDIEWCLEKWRTTFFKLQLRNWSRTISKCGKFRIMNFLMGKGYWEFITGDDTEPLFPKNPTQQQIQANKTWHEKTRKVLYWLSVNVSDSMIVHIQDAKSPKQAWDTLVKMYSTNTQAHKMQFKQKLHNLQKNKMNISDYSTKVKNLVDALASIRAPVDDENLVAVTLNGLGKDYSQFCTSIAVRETFPDFQNLITLLISEEMRVVGTSSNGGS